MKVHWLLFLILIPQISFARSFNATVTNFSKAKSHLTVIHADQSVTLYCGCKYSGNAIDLKSCGYKPVKDFKRAARLEWEHVVPAHAFGQAFLEWRNGHPKCVSQNKQKKMFKGRKCARTNPEFAKMEADLYNLYPEIGELNGLRSNYSMTAFGKNDRRPSSKTFGECKAIIADRKFEPMDRAKGIVARIYMYMDQAYPGRGIISDKNQKLFEAWNKMFPVTKEECSRARKIASVQGNENPILTPLCSAL